MVSIMWNGFVTCGELCKCKLILERTVTCVSVESGLGYTACPDGQQRRTEFFTIFLPLSSSDPLSQLPHFRQNGLGKWRHSDMESVESFDLLVNCLC